MIVQKKVALLDQRPRLRGRIHLAAAVVSVGGLIWLVRSAGSTRALVAAWIYGVAGVLLYLTSSTYHVFARSPRARRIMQRADHSMIYVLIAGTFTPVCMLAVHGTYRWAVLAGVWAGAVAGVVLKVGFFDRSRKIGGALYIGLGWAGMIMLPSLIHRPGLLGLIGAAGLLYTGGAILFSMRRPVLAPRWFGYHEMWHTFGVAAGGILFVANLGLVRAG